MTPARVSVVIPLYNKAPYIRRCLDSILKQRFEDWEIVVVDDGSTDESGSIVREYADPRIRFLTQANAGPGAARNRGSAEATGDLLAWLDADDFWDPDYLAESVRLLDAYGDSVACLTWAMLEYPGAVSTAPRWKRHGIGEGRYRVTPQTRPELLAAFLAHMLPSSTVMRRGDFLLLHGFYAKNRCLYAEDAYLWLKVLLVREVAFASRALVHKDCDAAELSTNLQGVRPIEPFLADPGELEALCPVGLRALLRRLLALRACKTASVYGYFGAHRQARALLRRFVRASDWRLPWFFVAVVGCTPAGKWLGGLVRWARINLRESHAP